MALDIREQAYIGHRDIVALNFINTNGPFVFRRHFRQGLRSHVIEVLRPEDVAVEKHGTVVNGTRWYPKAEPLHIFRIFRTRLVSLEQGLAEIRRVRMAEHYLLPDFLARSTEIIIDYQSPDGMRPILCGLQEYVRGEILDPWAPLPPGGLLANMAGRANRPMDDAHDMLDRWITTAGLKGVQFVERIKTMIAETGHIPDLAGIGNLIMERDGTIKLVDINNISTVRMDDTVHLDNRGYPVCDKSIEVLSILEGQLRGAPVDRDEPLYLHFLKPLRMQTVRDLEKAYHRRNSQA